jgi:hypothetical protein
MKLSSPAYMTFIAGLVLAIVIILPTNIKVYDPDTDKISIIEYDIKKRLIMLLFLSLPMAIHIYSVNCMVVGSCNIFAWFVAALILLWVVAFSVIAFFG